MRAVSTALFSVALVCVVVAFTVQADETEPAPKVAELNKAAEEAVRRQAAAHEALKAAQETLRHLNDQLAKTRAEQAEAEKQLKALEEQLKPQQEALAKAKAEHEEAAKRAAEAARKLEEAQTAFAKTEEALKGARATMASAPEAIKKDETQLAALKPQIEELQAAFDAAAADALAKRKAAERALIEAGELVSFAESIAPIFAKRCVACHNARTAKGRLNLETYAALMKGGESGASVDPGDGALSTLTLMLEDGSMPKDADPLAPEEIALVAKWIDTGATLDAGLDPDVPLITIMPKPTQPPAPEAYRVPMPVTALAFSPDGVLLATSGYHEVILWNPDGGAIVRRIGNIAERIYDLQFSSDGRFLAVAAGTPAQLGEVKLFNAADGSLAADLCTTGDSMFAVSFSPDGSRLAVAGADRTVRVYDVASRKELLLLEDHADWVMDIAWSPDGKQVATASRDKTAKVFDVGTGDSVITFNGHGQPVYGVGFLPDGKQVVTSGGDKQLRVWNVSDAKEVRRMGGFGDEVFRIEVSGEGHVYAPSADKTARSFQLADGKGLQTFGGHSDWVYAVAFHAGTKRLASGSYDGEVRIWNAEDGKELFKFLAAPGYTPAETAAK